LLPSPIVIHSAEHIQYFTDGIVAMYLLKWANNVVDCKTITNF
jgi:hypothetical protein